MSETRQTDFPINSASNPQLRSYNLNNFRDIPQIAKLGEQHRFDIEVVGNVLPFKANNYVVEQLIDWDKVILQGVEHANPGTRRRRLSRRYE